MHVNREISVVVCIDPGALVGLHVTLLSALVHVTDGVLVKIHVFYDGITENDFLLLRRTLDSAGKPYQIFPHPFDPAPFQKMKWMTGYMAYVRLVVPELVDTERLLYLDADLIVRANIYTMYNLNLGEIALGAVTWNDIQGSNDREFFRKLGWDLSLPYFNSGVLLIDVPKWREQNLTDRCLEIGERFGQELPSPDQTILNYLFKGRFCQIPHRYNTPVTASRAPLSPEDWDDRVIHLVGFPKPWSPIGFLNGQAKVFKEELDKTVLRGYRPEYNMRTIKTCLRKSKAYWKCLSGRLKVG